MDKIDYCFLDSAIEEIVGFGWIVPDNKHGDLAINGIPLSLNINEITEVLYRLFQEGNLLAINPTNLHEINTQLECDAILLNKGFIPSREEIKAALKEEKSLAYFLTQKGGEVWESVSYPQWDKHVSWLMDDENHILKCSNVTLAKKLIEIEHLVDSGGCYYSPVAETIKWKSLTPWCPNYWKKLPYGYEVSYQVTCINVNEDNSDTRSNKEKEKAERFVADIFNNWYTNYFKIVEATEP